MIVARPFVRIFLFWWASLHFSARTIFFLFDLCITWLVNQLQSKRRDLPLHLPPSEYAVYLRTGTQVAVFKVKAIFLGFVSSGREAAREGNRAETQETGRVAHILMCIVFSCGIRWLTGSREKITKQNKKTKAGTSCRPALEVHLHLFNVCLSSLRTVEDGPVGRSSLSGAIKIRPITWPTTQRITIKYIWAKQKQKTTRQQKERERERERKRNINNG